MNFSFLHEIIINWLVCVSRYSAIITVLSNYYSKIIAKVKDYSYYSPILRYCFKIHRFCLWL